MSLQESQNSPSSAHNQSNASDSAQSKRGRRLTNEDWISVIEKWENRDRMHDSFTLEELLKEHFGTYPSGCPVVPLATFYDQRRRMQYRLAQKNKLSTKT